MGRKEPLIQYRRKGKCEGNARFWINLICNVWECFSTIIAVICLELASKIPETISISMGNQAVQWPIKRMRFYMNANSTRVRSFPHFIAYCQLNHFFFFTFCGRWRRMRIKLYHSIEKVESTSTSRQINGLQSFSHPISFGEKIEKFAKISHTHTHKHTLIHINIHTKWRKIIAFSYYIEIYFDDLLFSLSFLCALFHTSR